MFDYVLNIPLSLGVNDVRVAGEPISLIYTKNHQQIKALLNGADVVNVSAYLIPNNSKYSTASTLWQHKHSTFLFIAEELSVKKFIFKSCRLQSWNFT